MKRYIYIIYFLIGIFSLSTILYYIIPAEANASTETYIHPLSPAITYREDSIHIRNVDWMVAEEVLMRYVTAVEKYISNPYNVKIIDTLLCEEIVDFYILNNPADGGLEEIQSITAYNLFSNNDGLCEMLEIYMQSQEIPQSLSDTIWIRIAKDLQGYVLIEEESDTSIIDEKRMFKFFFDNDYWFDKYEDYCPYTSSVLCN